MLYAIHKLRAQPLFHRHAYVSKQYIHMPCTIGKLGAHLFYEMHASGLKCNRSYSLCSSKKIGIALVQAACLHSEFIWHVGWPIWSEEAGPTHEGLALNIHIVIKCMENSFITSITITDKYCIDYWQLLQESKKFSDD